MYEEPEDLKEKVICFNLVQSQELSGQPRMSINGARYLVCVVRKDANDESRAIGPRLISVSHTKLHLLRYQSFEGK